MCYGPVLFHVPLIAACIVGRPSRDPANVAEQGVRYDRTVIAYHGCDADVARRLLDGEPFLTSNNAYDWLGGGIYFWEFGADRALAFAEEQVRWGRIKTPAVVGALLQLGECFDLLDTRYTIDVRDAWPLFATGKERAGEAVPSNTGRDLKARFADCALLNWYLGEAARDGLCYDSVRGAFIEGDPVFEGSAIHLESHIQICVRTPGCVIGVFQPRS